MVARGFANSPIDSYTSTGTLIQNLVPASASRNLRGIFALPGTFFTANCFGPDYTSELFLNTGTKIDTFATGGTKFFPQAIAKTKDGFYLIPQNGNNSVLVYDEFGNYVTSFGSTELVAPFQAVEIGNNDVIVTSNTNGTLYRYSHNGSNFTYQGVFASGFLQPTGLGYCPSKDTILFGDYTAQRVYSCTSAGACAAIVSAGLGVVRGVVIDINSTDCSFFVGSGSVIARFHGDGSVDNLTLINLSSSFFQGDFLIPADD